MRGSITKRTGPQGVAYRVRYDVPTPDGGRKQASETVPTKKEAEALLARRLRELQSGAYVAPTTETVGELLDRWLTGAAGRLAESTVHRYEGAIRLHLMPALGGVALGKLTTLMVQACYDKQVAAGGGASALRTTHNALSQALDQGVAWGLIARNVASGAQLPAAQRGEAPTWTAEQVRTFLAKTADDPLGPLYRLALDAGMRIGELVALRWADVDLDRGVLAVRRTVSRTRDGKWLAKDGAKTAGGRRPIALMPSTVDALRAHRAKQNERRLRLGPHWAAEDVVFDRGDGEPWHVQVARDRFQRAVMRAGLPRITPHGMRHTMATVMLVAGVHPKVVQERLGHRSIAMTLDRYSHVTMDMQRGAAAALDAVISGPRENDRDRTVPESGVAG